MAAEDGNCSILDGMIARKAKNGENERSIFCGQGYRKMMFTVGKHPK